METSFFNSENFRFVIDSEPDITFYITSGDIPSSSLASIPTSYRGGKSFQPGDSREYSPLSLNLIVDEKLKSYRRMHQWLNDLACSENPVSEFKDVSLILYSSHNNPTIDFKFINAFPVSVGSIPISNQVTDDTPPTFSIEFAYDYLDINDN